MSGNLCCLGSDHPASYNMKPSPLLITSPSNNLVLANVHPALINFHSAVVTTYMVWCGLISVIFCCFRLFCFCCILLVVNDGSSSYLEP